MRDAKGVRACARDAQTLTPRADGRVRALRARDATQEGGRAAGARDAPKGVKNERQKKVGERCSKRNAFEMRKAFEKKRQGTQRA